MKYVPCNVCGSDNWSVRYPSTLSSSSGPGEGYAPQVEAFRCTSAGYGEHTQIVTCHVCGHIYANPTWEPHELMAAYETVEDETYVAEREGRELTFQKHLEAIEALIGFGNGRTLLDVGAYIGVFVEIANQAGWDAAGIEPSDWAVAEAQSRGLNVTQGTLDAPQLAGKQFDLITFWDVIEHVEDPRAEIEKAHRLLKPGGMLVLHTMDVGSLTAKAMGHRWPWYMAMHVHFFSKQTLARLVVDCGYQLVQTATEGRYLRMGYLASRLAGISRPLGSMINWLIEAANLSEKAVPINFGDLFTIYAIKPRDASH